MYALRPFCLLGMCAFAGLPTAGGHWLELTLAVSASVRQAHVYSGYRQETGSTLRSFRLERADGQGGWLPTPGAAVASNQAFALALTFDAPVTGDRFRLRIDDPGFARLREIGLWAEQTPLFTGVLRTEGEGFVYMIVTAQDDASGLPESVTLPLELRTGVVAADLLGHGPLPVGPDGLVLFPPDVRARPPCAHAWALRLRRAP